MVPQLIDLRFEANRHAHMWLRSAVTKIGWLSSVMVVLLGCTPLTTSNDTPPLSVHTPIVVTVVGSAPTLSDHVECDQPPNGMLVTIELQGANEVKVVVKGLQPSEHPILEMRTTAGNRTRILTSQNVEPVGADGMYEFIEPFQSPDTTGHSTWIIRVLHEKGAYCLSMIL